MVSLSFMSLKMLHLKSLLFLYSLILPKTTVGQGNPPSLNTPITASGERHCEVIDDVVSELRRDLPSSSLNDRIPLELLDPMGFLRVLAYVETQDGLDYVNDEGGLWKVDTSLFDGGYCQLILGLDSEVFTLSFEVLEASTFNGPLYSAVGALLSLLCISSTEGPPLDVNDLPGLYYHYRSESMDEAAARAKYMTGYDNYTMNPCRAVCSNNMVSDVIVLMDSSGSVGPTNFQKALNYTVELSQLYTLGEDDSRFGVIFFNHDVITNLSIPLNFTYDHSQLADKIMSTVYYGGGTAAIGKAVNYTTTNGFTTKFGSRIETHSNIPQVLIVATDGRSADEVTVASQFARQRNINTFSIGVGNNVDSQQLDNIAGSSSRVFRPEDYDELIHFALVIHAATCRELINLDPEDSVQLTLLSNDIRFLKLNLPESDCDGDTLMLSVHGIGGVTTIYASFEYTNPNAELYHFQWTIQDGGTFNGFIELDQQNCNMSTGDDAEPEVLYLGVTVEGGEVSVNVNATPDETPESVGLALEVVSVQLDEDVISYTCTSTCNCPTANVSWLRDSLDTTLPRSANITYSTIDNNTAVATLTLDTTSPGYEGYYVCEIKSTSVIGSVRSQTIAVPLQCRNNGTQIGFYHCNCSFRWTGRACEQASEGCRPQIFLPATPLGTRVSLPCSTIHPSVRGSMEWTCMSDFTFDGHLDCYFEDNANNSIALVTYVLVGSHGEVATNQQRIKDHIDERLHGILGNNISSQIVEIRHLGYNLVEFALAVELATIPSVAAFARLAVNTSSGFAPGGYPSQPNLIGSPIITPSDSCSCPIFYHNIRPQFTPGNPRVFGCRGPSYARSPCRCDPGSYQLRACKCFGVYTTNSTDSDGLKQCQLDTDGDGIPNSIDTCEGCCLKDLSVGIMWSSILQGISDRQPCNLFHSSFNDETFVTRKCSNKGHWLPVDVSGCTFKESAELPVVVVVLSVRAGENAIRVNETAFKNQVMVKYFSEYNILSNITISMYAPGQEEGETVVTCSLELPENAFDSVIGKYSTPRKKRDFDFLQEPVIYGFRPANECLCQDPNNITNFTSSTNICKGKSLSPCLCDDTRCQCLSPFVNVTSSSGPLKCSLDTDGDGLPDHQDPDPHVYDTSQLQPMEGCHAEEGVVCLEESTASPSIDWYQVSGCYEAVAMCSTELTNIIGQARRLCDSTGQWMEPDVSQCQSVATREAEILIHTVLSAITNAPIVQEGGVLQLNNETIQLLDAASESLSSTTGNQQEALLPRDLSSTISYLNSFAMFTETTTLLTSEGFNATNLFSITSNILNEQNTDTWNTITNETSNVGTNLLNATERLSFSYALNASTSNSPRMVRLDNLVVDVRVVTSGSDENVTITRGGNSQSSVSIPGCIVSEEEDTAVVVVFIDRLSEYLPRRLSNQMALNASTSLSNIISIQVGRGQRSFENQSLVDITFTDITGDPICVFWKSISSADGNISDGWSTDGISNSTVPGAPGTVVCRASHLTNFAILVSSVSLPPESPVYKSLQVISYIGCIISLLCLLATIMFLISLRKELFTKLNQFVHLNFCIALACGLLVFMVGAQTAKDIPVLCVIVACLLHYFFLATFFWTLCEAVVMYNLLVRVFFANSRKWIFLYLPLGWGTPLPIVIISAAIRHDYYIISSHGQTVACWLSWDMGTIAAFIVPMCLVLLVNAILTCFIMRSLYKFYRGVGGEYNIKNDETKAKDLVQKLVKAFVFISPLLGFTWLVGLLAVNEGSLIFAFVFVILNSLQGAAIFVFYVLRHDKVRPKISALFTRCKRIKPYLTARRSALSRIPPTESMEVLSPGTPTTTKASFSGKTSKLATVSMSYKDSIHNVDSEDVPSVDNDEVQEAVVTFDTTEEGRKVSTISFTLHERDDVVSSASAHVKQ